MLLVCNVKWRKKRVFGSFYLDRGCRLDLKEVLRGNGGLMQLGKHLMRRKLSSVWVQGSWQGFLYLFGK